MNQPSDGPAAEEGTDDSRPKRDAEADTTDVTEEDPPPVSEPSPAADEQYCRSCGSVIKREAAICPECGVEQSQSGSGSGPAVLLAAVGLFIPLFAGAGQLYNGEIAKGILITVVQIINAVLIFVVIGVFTYPIVSAYAMYDAYHGAE